MRICEHLTTGLKYQGNNLPLKDICFNLILSDDYVLPYCFYIAEDTDYLTVVTTTDEGLEEVRTVNKSMVLFVSVVYNLEDLFVVDDDEEEVMYL